MITHVAATAPVATIAPAAPTPHAPFPQRSAAADAIAAQAIERLVAEPIGGYTRRGPAASEPIAWAALALAAAGRRDAARRATEWLAARQQRDGSVGVTEEDRAPGWPTSLAMLAWDAVDPAGYAERIARGARWALDQEPWTQPRSRVFGHDSTLEGWSWAPDTHSWLEPTAFFVLALRRAGLADAARTRQAVRMLVDRLLPGGGANYGNTFVLGQELLQHVQPTGVAALALADEGVADPRFARTLAYLDEASRWPTGAASFAYAALGLAANRRPMGHLVDPLRDAWDRARVAGGGYKTALVALAAQALSDPRATLAFARGPRS